MLTAALCHEYANSLSCTKVHHGSAGWPKLGVPRPDRVDFFDMGTRIPCKCRHARAALVSGGKRNSFLHWHTMLLLCCG